jgi:hypothetical protein
VLNLIPFPPNNEIIGFLEHLISDWKFLHLKRRVNIAVEGAERNVEVGTLVQETE